MPILRQQRGSPFSFPNRAPGFDVAHVAGRGTVLSCIASTGGAVNLLNGQPGSIVGSPTANLLGTMGPSTKFGANANDMVTFPFVAALVSNSPITMAVIFFPTTISAQKALIGAGNNNGILLRDNIGPLGFRIVGVADLSSGFTPTVNTPFFYAASARFNGTNWDHSHVLTNLNTGSIKSSTTLGTTGAIGTVGTFNFCFGNNSGTSSQPGSMAAGMIATQSLSLPQLVTWGADPWAFWYPRSNYGAIDIGAIAAAGGFKAAWAQQNNYPVIGTGPY